MARKHVSTNEREHEKTTYTLERDGMYWAIAVVVGTTRPHRRKQSDVDPGATKKIKWYQDLPQALKSLHALVMQSECTPPFTTETLLDAISRSETRVLAEMERALRETKKAA